MIEVKNGIGKTSRIQRKGNNIETIRTSSYSDSKLRTLKADIYSYLKENQGELEKLKERLTELREISEKKYMFVEKNIENMIKLTNYLERKIVKGNKYEKTSTSLYNWKYDLKWMWSKRRK